MHNKPFQQVPVDLCEVNVGIGSYNIVQIPNGELH